MYQTLWEILLVHKGLNKDAMGVTGVVFRNQIKWKTADICNDHCLAVNASI